MSDGIKRLDWGHDGMIDSHDGDYVEYEDHIAATAPTTAADAKKQLVAAAGDVGEHESSLDQAADALLLRISQFFGECVGGSTFCGLDIVEQRDANGLLQSLSLTACDLVSGEPVRRVGK